MLIVYDGVCNFCNSWVRFVAKRDHDSVFTFASAESPTGSAVMHGAGLNPENPASIVLVDGNRYLQKSEAVLTILSQLGGFWFVVSTLHVLPKSFRDYCYTHFAAHRYSLFGKSDHCQLPPVEWRDRFVI
jgi:predicted DCC family thiol-disulfide oxidoreductase YuxK